MKGTAGTVTEYLASLPVDRRKEIAAVRKMVKANLPKGYRETMGWGMINWEIPLSTYTKTHGQYPLCYAALGAQKNYLSLYLMAAYGDAGLTARIKTAFQEAGKKLDVGKSCIRFKQASDLPLAALGEIVAAVPPALYILRYEELVLKPGRKR